MQFGRNLERGPGKPWIDAAALELLPLAVLRREAAAAGLMAHEGDPRERPAKLLVYSRLTLEVARRTGESDTLAKAMKGAERAARLSVKPGLVAAAHLAHAHAAVVGGQILSQPKADELAEASLAAPEVAASPAFADRALALRARVEAMRALAGADLDAAVEAAGVFDAAVERFDAQAREDSTARLEAAALRCDRAELLIGFGLRLKDRSLLVQAEADLRQLRQKLDPDLTPLTWARTEAMRGLAQAGIGELTGDERALAEGVRILAGAAEHADIAYSPMDRTRISHWLAHALQSLAEASDDEGMFDHAVAIYDQALTGMTAMPALPLRGLIIYDRAACLTARAERAGDLAELRRAESGFRAEVARRSADADPVSWAVAQLALIRVYEVRSRMLGVPSVPPETAVALTEAMDVFAEHGLALLAQQAEEALARLRETFSRS